MSIYDGLLSWVNDGELFEFQPQMPGTLAMRRMFASKEVNALPWGEDRYARLRADLDRFTQGDIIAVRFPPSKSVEAYLALLEPADERIWEIRSTQPEPQLRVFGHFAQADTFIALKCGERKDFETEEDWKLTFKGCQTEWRRLLPAYEPVAGTNIHDYITRKYFLV